MSTVLYQQQGAAISLAASLTRYMQITANSRFSDDVFTESIANNTFRSGGVLSNLFINILTNDRDASSFRTRKNSADASMVVSITGSTTGVFEDTVNTDAVTAAEEWNYKLVTGANGTTFTFRIAQVLFAATTNTVARTGGDENGAVDLGTSATRSGPLAGDSVTTTAIADSSVGTIYETDGTLSNMQVNITANARSTTSTIVSRINSAAGALSIAVTAGSTGIFEDTSNSDTITANDLVNWAVVSGTGTGNVSFGLVCADFTTTNGNFMLIAAAGGGQTVLTGVTTYYPIAGALRTSTTEADMNAQANLIMATSLMQVNLTANTIVENSLFRLRKNAGNGNQVVTCTGLTTGVFQDTTNSDSLVATDVVDYSLVTGATGTSLVVRSVALLADSTVAGGTVKRSTMCLMGVG